MGRRLILVLLISAASGVLVSAQDLVLTNATILDPMTRTPVRGSLWIDGGTVAGRGPKAPASAPGERIDLQGKWIIPGLVDMHVHSYTNLAPPLVVDPPDVVGSDKMALRVLRAGVTAFLDLFALEDGIFALRDRQRRGEVGGADIFAAGPCLTATDGARCKEYGVLQQFGMPTRVIDSPEDARRTVAELAVKGADVIKVVYDHVPGRPTSIDRATLDAVVAAARQHNLKTIVHVGVWEDVRHAVQAGATAVTKVPADGPIPDDVIALMAARHTVHIPTLASHTDRQAFFDAPEFLESPLLVALAPEVIRNAYQADTKRAESAAERRAAAARTIESVRRLHAAGVPILTGTDSGNYGAVHGYSVHRELIKLVEAGLTRWEALAASTTQAGAFLGRRYGVQPGDSANLVVLDASPLVDIANTQEIAMVIMRGSIAYRR